MIRQYMLINLLNYYLVNKQNISDMNIHNDISVGNALLQYEQYAHYTD